MNQVECCIMFAAVYHLPVKPASDSENRMCASAAKTVPNFLVRFVNIPDRDAVIQAAMKYLHQGRGLSVVSDLPPQINQIRQSLLLRRKSMSSEGKKKVNSVYTKFYPFVMLKIKQPKHRD